MEGGWREGGQGIKGRKGGRGREGGIRIEVERRGGKEDENEIDRVGETKRRDSKSIDLSLPLSPSLPSILSSLFALSLCRHAPSWSSKSATTAASRAASALAGEARCPVAACKHTHARAPRSSSPPSSSARRRSPQAGGGAICHSPALPRRLRLRCCRQPRQRPHLPRSRPCGGRRARASPAASASGRRGSGPHITAAGGGPSEGRCAGVSAW